MLPESIPAASAISRTVVARKPFCANNSLAILTMSARRCDLPVPFPAGAAARLADWLLRDGPIAPLWLVGWQPPKRLLGSAAWARPVRPAGRCGPGRWWYRSPRPRTPVGLGRGVSLGR